MMILAHNGLHAQPDSSDWLYVDLMWWGYCKLEYHWGYFEGTLQEYHASSTWSVTSKYPHWHSNLQLPQRYCVIWNLLSQSGWIWMCILPRYQIPAKLYTKNTSNTRILSEKIWCRPQIPKHVYTAVLPDTDVLVLWELYIFLSLSVSWVTISWFSFFFNDTLMWNSSSTNIAGDLHKLIQNMTSSNILHILTKYT